jgi:hypothetical protein
LFGTRLAVEFKEQLELTLRDRAVQAGQFYPEAVSSLVRPSSPRAGMSSPNPSPDGKRFPVNAQNRESRPSTSSRIGNTRFRDDDFN